MRLLDPHFRYVPAEAARQLCGALNLLLADLFALYIKTTKLRWHLSGPHLRDYHLLLDGQADQILATIKAITQRVRRIGGTTLPSVGRIADVHRVLDSEADFAGPLDLLAQLRDDNMQLAARMREASACRLEVWIGEAEGRARYLCEASWCASDK